MRALTVTCISLLLAAPASAQRWTAEEQGLINHIKMCWNAWVAALAEETPDSFYAQCPTDENAHFWWTEEGAPDNREDIYRRWKVIREVDDDWAGLRPVNVNIFGDVGIVHMYGYWFAATSDGLVTTEAKRTEVFQRRNGRWVFLGAQGTPSTPADADPYR